MREFALGIAPAEEIATEAGAVVGASGRMTPPEAYDEAPGGTAAGPRDEEGEDNEP